MCQWVWVDSVGGSVGVGRVGRRGGVWVCLCMSGCLCGWVWIHDFTHISIQGKTVLELAAGIGRFTGDFADKAKFLTVVEFMETFMKANIQANGKALQQHLHFFLDIGDVLAHRTQEECKVSTRRCD